MNGFAHETQGKVSVFKGNRPHHISLNYCCTNPNNFNTSHAAMAAPPSRNARHGPFPRARFINPVTMKMKATPKMVRCCAMRYFWHVTRIAPSAKAESVDTLAG